MSPHRFRVAVCGGGVGGLVCAVALSRYHDIHIDVYEAASAFTEIGAGIGVWPRAWKVLCSLGLADELAKIAVVPPTDIPQIAFHFRKGDQPEGVNFYTLSTPGGLLAFHRADFHGVLLRHLGRHCGKHTSKRLVSYTQSRSRDPSIRLDFQDGSSATCDVLIGADGVKSAARACLVEELAAVARAEGRHQDAQKVLAAGPPKWSGTVAYRALFPSQTLRQRLPSHRVLENPMLYLGKNSEITVYPIQRGAMINLAAFRARYDLEYTTFKGPWMQDVPPSEVLHDFDNWEPEVRMLLQSAERVNRWAIHTTLPLPSFVSGKVALLGDSAHAMMPYQGAGAGQAIEDAFILATVLGDRRTTQSTISRALRVYDSIRRPFALRIQEASRENGILYTLNYPGLTFDRPACAQPGSEDAEKLKEIRTRIRMNWEWAWKTTLDGDVSRALRQLDDPAYGS
ncbi:FAD/NAD(P)-binding domain-containing protein [Lentinus brumalis]|uniref:FAD/NAD(P)-binding domain-containing protein n=1 Tax=Lentinus brumalis TaxID=2498619 RepID=A0A371DEB9_9APHY|nr:FAD/NAD(P)-binding domain-containing protein [Polyporus brumalis]